MPILGAAHAAELVAISALAAVSVPVLALAGVFRARPVTGPERMLPGESIVNLMGILILSASVGYFAAFAIWQAIHLSIPKDHAEDVITAAAELSVLACLLLLSSRLRPRGLQQLGLTTRNFFRAIPRALLGIWGIFPLVYAAMIVVQLVIELLHRKLPEAHPMLQQLQGSEHTIWFAVIVFEAVVLAPMVEESLFRGFIQTILVYVFGRRSGPTPTARWVGIIITALLFGAVHGELAFVFPLFVLAVGLGYVYERTGNLWACIFIHGAFNAMQIGIFTLKLFHGKK